MPFVLVLLSLPKPALSTLPVRKLAIGTRGASQEVQQDVLDATQSGR
jgi:hypothetical protein